MKKLETKMELSKRVSVSVSDGAGIELIGQQKIIKILES